MIPEVNSFYHLEYNDDKDPIYSYTGTGKFVGKTTTVANDPKVYYLFNNLKSKPGYTNEAYFGEENIKQKVDIPSNSQ
jgi:hypothetical protein